MRHQVRFGSDFVSQILEKKGSHRGFISIIHATRVRNPNWDHERINVKRFTRNILCALFLSGGTALAFFGLTYHGALSVKPLRLAYEHPLTTQVQYAPVDPKRRSAIRAQAAAAANGPTFGHPIISGIQGTGFEADLRVDPSNPHRIYSSVPGSDSSDTSWIWQTLDNGLTFKWVPAATAYEGKATPPCAGGGDAEVGIASNGSI